MCLNGTILAIPSKKKKKKKNSVVRYSYDAAITEARQPANRSKCYVTL